MPNSAIYETYCAALWATCLKRSNCEFPCKYKRSLQFVAKDIGYNAGIVLIAPPRTGSSDSTETPVLQTYFTVRRPYVVRALHWLKDHNTLYRDVEIEEVSDDASSSQTAVNEIAFDDEGESSVIRRDLQMPNVEVSHHLNNNNAPVYQLQRVQGAPISIYTCADAEQMVFPWLYPDGTNGY